MFENVKKQSPDNSRQSPEKILAAVDG
jgi:hypothetical protein